MNHVCFWSILFSNLSLPVMPHCRKKKTVSCVCQKISWKTRKSENLSDASQIESANISRKRAFFSRKGKKDFGFQLNFNAWRGCLNFSIPREWKIFIELNFFFKKAEIKARFLFECERNVCKQCDCLGRRRFFYFNRLSLLHLIF